jgi:hypothetical protein
VISAGSFLSEIAVGAPPASREARRRVAFDAGFHERNRTTAGACIEGDAIMTRV